MAGFFLIGGERLDINVYEGEDYEGLRNKVAKMLDVNVDQVHMAANGTVISDFDVVAAGTQSVTVFIEDIPEEIESALEDSYESRQLEQESKRRQRRSQAAIDKIRFLSSLGQSGKKTNE